MPEGTSREEREIYFQGRVQGVGFRYTTRRIAAEFEVAGYVQNLPDGRVRVVAAGEPGELDRFVQAIEIHLGRYIHQRQESRQPDRGQFHHFDIRY